LTAGKNGLAASSDWILPQNFQVKMNATIIKHHLSQSSLMKYDSQQNRYPNIETKTNQQKQHNIFQPKLSPYCFF